MVNGITNQQVVISELGVAMYAYGAILRQGRIDALAIADKAIKVLDAISEKSANEFKVTLGVIGAGVAAVTAIRGATKIDIGLGLLGASLSAISTGVDAAQEGASATVEAAMNSLSVMFENLRTAMDDQERGLAAALDKSKEAVLESVRAGYSEARVLLPVEPDNDTTDISDGDVPRIDDEFRPRR